MDIIKIKAAWAGYEVIGDSKYWLERIEIEDHPDISLFATAGDGKIILTKDLAKLTANTSDAHNHSNIDGENTSDADDGGDEDEEDIEDKNEEEKYSGPLDVEKLEEIINENLSLEVEVVK